MSLDVIKAPFSKWKRAANKWIVNPVSAKMNRAQSSTLEKVGKYAFERFARSQYARETMNMLPLMVLTIIIRNIVNLLIFYRFCTGVWFVDFVISVCVTVGTTIVTPFFYAVAESQKVEFMKFTDNAIDNILGPNGWDYLIRLRTIIVLIVSSLLLIFLQFVEINSRDLQELIVHTLIASWIIDKFQQWNEYIRQPKWIKVETIFMGQRRLTTSNLIYWQPRASRVSYHSTPLPQRATVGMTVIPTVGMTVRPTVKNINKAGYINNSNIVINNVEKQINIVFSDGPDRSLRSMGVRKKPSRPIIRQDYRPSKSKPIQIMPGRPVRKKSMIDTVIRGITL